MSRLRAPGMWPCRGSHGLPCVPSYSCGVRTSRIGTSPSRAASSSTAMSLTGARTSSTSAAIDGRSASSASHVGDALAAARRRACRARGSPTARRRRPRRGSAPPRARRAARRGRSGRRGGTRSSRRRGSRRSDARAAARAHARRGPPGSSGGRVALLEVLHDHLRLGQHEAVVEHRHAARGGFSSSSHCGTVREVDLDASRARAPSRRARSARARSTGSAARRSSFTARAPSAPRSARRARRPAAGRPASPPVRATRRTSSRSAPVSRATSVGFASSASSSPFGSAP